jgi:hypothetical protein
MQPDLFLDVAQWRCVERSHPAARALADRHYSRQTPGAQEFMASGKTFVLLLADERAVWGVIENLDPAGNLRWRCSIFRNESPVRSSSLIVAATRLTYRHWAGRLPSVPLTTEVDPRKTRRKRDPGRCFLRAGWTVIDPDRRGLVVLQAPPLTPDAGRC